MKPEKAKAHFINQPDSIVASLCMSQLVDEYRMELIGGQQSVNPGGKRDTRTQNAVHCRTTSAGSCLSVAMVSADPEAHPHKHRDGAKRPHHAEHCNRCRADRDAALHGADSASRCEPREA